MGAVLGHGNMSQLLVEKPPNRNRRTSRGHSEETPRIARPETRLDPVSVKTHVIRVSVQQRHAAVFGNPVDLPLPNVDFALEAP